MSSRSFRNSSYIGCSLMFVVLFLSNHAYADSDTSACIKAAKEGLLEIADTPDKRFLGKVEEDTARCRGGDKAVKYRDTPWVDWGIITLLQISKANTMEIKQKPD